MYSFANNDYADARREANPLDTNIEMSEETICDWYQYSRELIVLDYIKREEDRDKIGRNFFLQIDESKFGKRKYNRGRQVCGHWILGKFFNNFTL